MDEIEKEYKEKNKLTDDTLLVRNWQDILAVYIYQQSKSGKTSFTCLLYTSSVKVLPRLDFVRQFMEASGTTILLLPSSSLKRY